jgi:hypothetical protein
MLRLGKGPRRAIPDAAHGRDFGRPSLRARQHIMLETTAPKAEESEAGYFTVVMRRAGELSPLDHAMWAHSAEGEARGTETASEPQAPDHHGVVVGEIHVVGDLVVLVADVAAKAAEVDDITF